MKTKLTLITFLVACTSILSAQNARTILDNASEAYQKAGGIIATFTLESRDTKAKDTYSYDGTAHMKEDKFKIEIPDAITWFDGATQWVYIKDTDEVNISSPTGEELQSISPSVLFNIYKKGFNLSYKGEKRSAGKLVHEIELTPQKKTGDFTKIVVQINKANNIFHRITLTDKNGLENTLTIVKYQTRNALADDTFKFNKVDYPSAEIIDLR
ncbi:outer membrane lipoprotein carrier protein LolA [Dysgonomonas sp. Marseille-P4361]|uniref:LolA family protein n=1 Tax=Dysgonomonas sp. Marseille-P4361 TaxID=2161820 RepID=UPI000D54D517|nr:outer membrane lipoprotein carrier protein LolA [Dysgonomonas sp. Marseille-P4361]